MLDHRLGCFLVKLIARVDARFLLPSCRLYPRGFKTCFTRQATYHSLGIAWRLGTDKAQERLVRRAEDEGLILIAQRRGPSSTLHLKPTKEAEALARSLVGLNSLVEAWIETNRIADVGGDKWVCASALGVIPGEDCPGALEGDNESLDITPDYRELNCTRMHSPLNQPIANTSPCPQSSSVARRTSI